MPGLAGEKHLGFGGAALSLSMAAQRRVCVFSRSNVARSARLGVSLGIFLCLFFCLVPASHLIHARAARLEENAGSAQDRYLFHAFLNLDTLDEKLDEFPGAEARPDAGQSRSGTVIDKIDFVGNRRIRTDTLKARIFSRDGDPYNEETLRRDFQALWNTQFFEDVKLRVEDSPSKPNAKVIVFEVKERPVIRRIRYDGIHSISESDILDRFKDKKVGLTVESQFDPTRIKKAEVVLKDLLAEHGRQFAAVTPQYERIASSNAASWSSRSWKVRKSRSDTSTSPATTRSATASSSAPCATTGPMPSP